MAARTKSPASILCVAASFVLFPLSAHAIPVTWQFSGTMVDTGNPFSGFVSFESERPDTNTSEQRGQFTFVDLGQANLGIDVEGTSIDAAEVHADGRVPDYVAEADVMNDVDLRGDLFRFTSNVLIDPPPTIEGLQEFTVDLFFIDESGAWLSDAFLPTTAPDLASLMLQPGIDGWGDYFSLTSAAGVRVTTSSSNFGQHFRYGTIDSLTTISVPEPATISLLGAGLLAMLARRRREA